jgi:predicted MFS family arabinose efflux permease
MSDPQPPAPHGRDPFAEGRQFVDGAYQRADRMIDHGSDSVFRLLWLFLPQTSIARKRRFQYIMASTFLADAARDALKYGALIAVVRGGGSTLDAALVGIAALVPPALFGLYGGAVADVLPKRIALGAAYFLQAAVCFIIPALYGTDLVPILWLIFLVNVFGQVSGPTEQSFTPLVASQEELASAVSLTSLASNAGTTFGTTLLAPVLVVLFGAYAVFYLAGALLFVAMGRILHVRTSQDEQKYTWKRPDANVLSTVRWLVDQPAVATMIVVGVLVGTASIVLQTLGPRYVQTVLGVDPADTVYVFLPSGIGLLIALVLSPKLIRLRGERFAAIGGFVVVATALCMLGLVQRNLPTLIDPVNPIRSLGFVGIHLGAPMRTASILALPLGFGLALTGMAVQTYVNRRIPLAYQGRAFALQSVLKNGASIIPLLTLGAVAEVVGVDTVLVASPIVLIAIAIGLIQLSFRFSGRAPAPRLVVLSSFWEEPKDAAPPP